MKNLFVETAEEESQMDFLLSSSWKIAVLNRVCTSEAITGQLSAIMFLVLPSVLIVPGSNVALLSGRLLSFGFIVSMSSLRIGLILCLPLVSGLRSPGSVPFQLH